MCDLHINAIAVECKHLGLTVLCETKWDETKQNENLYFAKWKSVVCEMKICTLQNGNLYFAKRKSVTLFDILAASEQKIVSCKKTHYIPCTKCQNIRKMRMA